MTKGPGNEVARLVYPLRAPPLRKFFFILISGVLCNLLVILSSSVICHIVKFLYVVEFSQMKLN